LGYVVLRYCLSGGYFVEVSGVLDEFLVFGVEMLCDEIGVGIVRGEMLFVDVVVSSVEEYVCFGGLYIDCVVCEG